MSVDDAPKVFLQNKLSKCRSKLQELGPLLDGKSEKHDLFFPKSHVSSTIGRFFGDNREGC